MPVHVAKRSGSRPYKIVERSGKVVGSSASRANAKRSANARNASRKGWKPTGKKARR